MVRDKFLKKYSFNILIYICFFVILCLFIANKKNYHVDELLTYQLANSFRGYMTPVDGDNYYPSDKAWLEYLTVQNGYEFDYNNVWKNQEADVHPPIYYVLLHTICSFTPEKFTVWQAGLINIIFSILTLWVVRELLFELTLNRTVVFEGTAFFVLSAGILSAASFFRMYIMVMFELTYITLLFVKNIGKNCTLRFYISIVITAILGALTHYYFLIYLFFLCLIYGIYLLIHRKFKDMIIFIVSMMLSGVLSIMIFPPMIQQIFLREGDQKKVTVENLQKMSALEYLNRLKSFYDFINEQLFGGVFIYLLFAGLIFYICSVVNSHDSGEEKYTDNKINKINIKWIIVFLPSMCYFFVIAKIAVWITDRYLFPVYAVVTVGITCLMHLAYKGLLKSNKLRIAVCSCLFSIMIVSGWKICGWSYLYMDSVELLEKAGQYNEDDNIFIYDINWKIAPSYREISKYKSVTFFHKNNIELLNETSVRNNASLVVTVIDSCGAEAILNKVMEICPLLDSYEKIGSFGYATSYYLYSQNCSINQYRIYDYAHKKLLGSSNKAFIEENVCTTVHDNVIREVAYEDTGYVNLWIDNWVLDIKNGTLSDGTNIWLWKHNGLGAQDWVKQLNDDGTVTFVFRDDKFALTRNDEGNVYLGAHKNNDISQKWWLETVE